MSGDPVTMCFWLFCTRVRENLIYFLSIFPFIFPIGLCRAEVVVRCKSVLVTPVGIDGYEDKGSRNVKLSTRATETMGVVNG